MVKRNMKESMDNITNIKDSTAALSPEMQLAKERAKDKDEEFEKIVLGKDGVLGASKQPTPDKPKWSLDESLFDRPISLNEAVIKSASDLSDLSKLARQARDLNNERLDLLKRMSKIDLSEYRRAIDEIEEEELYYKAEQVVDEFYDANRCLNTSYGPGSFKESFKRKKVGESFNESISDDLKEVNLNKFNIGTLPYQVLQFLWDLSENGKLDDRSLERQAKNILELINRNMSNESLNKSLKGKKLTESYDDGWSSSIREELNDLTSELYSFCYEMENCVRGAYTRAETAEELGDYLIDLGDRISSEGEIIKDYPTEDGEDEEFKESLNESIPPITKKEVTEFFTNKGFDVNAEDVQDYIDGVTEYINQWREEGDDYSIQDWYSDTRMNYPEDLEDLTRLDDDDDFDESLNEDIEVSDEDDVWDLIDSGYMDSEGIGDFLSEHDTAWDDICAFFDIEESDFDDQWDALIQIDAHDLADWISTHDQLWDDFCSYVYALRDRTLNGVDESLNEDTVKQNGKWVNKGDTGKTHGKFDTKKEADAQRKAMFANGFKG